MKRILSVTDLLDGGERAIQYGNVLADQFNAEFFICHVIELPANIFCDFQYNPTPYLERTISDATEDLHKIVNRNHIEAELILRVRCTEKEIPTVIDEKKIDFVVFPLEVKTGPIKFLQKNIVGRLARSISCPLLVIPYKKPGLNIEADNLRFDKILIGCEPLKILPSTMECIIRISDIFSSELHFICITNREFHFQEFQKKMYDTLKKTIEQFVPGGNEDLIRTMKTVLKSGNPPDQLLEYAKKNSIDMIFLDTKNSDYGKRCYSPSSVKRIISKAHCPVLLPNSN